MKALFAYIHFESSNQFCPFINRIFYPNNRILFLLVLNHSNINIHFNLFTSVKLLEDDLGSYYIYIYTNKFLKIRLMNEKI